MADGVADRMVILGGPDLARGPEVADPWFNQMKRDELYRDLAHSAVNQFMKVK